MELTKSSSFTSRKVMNEMSTELTRNILVIYWKNLNDVGGNIWNQLEYWNEVIYPVGILEMNRKNHFLSVYCHSSYP